MEKQPKVVVFVLTEARYVGAPLEPRESLAENQDLAERLDQLIAVVGALLIRHRTALSQFLADSKFDQVSHHFRVGRREAKRVPGACVFFLKNPRTRKLCYTFFW